MFMASFPAIKSILPSRKQLKDDLGLLFKVSENLLRSRLANTQAAIHISLDGWTDRSGKSFIGVIANWGDNQVIKRESKLIKHSAMINFI
jgi:hypothetical protein